MAFVVVYDACVLHPTVLRDVLIRIAGHGVVRARWSDQILDECFRSIQRARPGLDPQKLARTRGLMVDAVPDCLVTGYEHLTEGLELIDAADRHVVATAVRASAQVIVTFNQRHFPDHALEAFDIETKHPDEFLLDTIDLARGPVVASINHMSRTYRSPSMTPGAILDALRNLGLVRSATRLRDLISP